MLGKENGILKKLPQGLRDHARFGRKTNFSMSAILSFPRLSKSPASCLKTRPNDPFLRSCVSLNHRQSFTAVGTVRLLAVATFLEVGEQASSPASGAERLEIAPDSVSG
ncbi:hypothetical protein K0M31_013522 [Melipona bicolor]|uniref:Uncharacterized protein n=1 Tax=Melipona bicolor TaxID=60889 RepID=A0AA40FIT4_9HYME|nr:hypothetical protein K0M31_013522 [Melipona bicolor]